MKKHLVIVETMTTGTGFKVIDHALDEGHEVSFVCESIDPYRQDLKRERRKDFRIINCKTREESSLYSALKEIKESRGINCLVGLQDYGLEVLAKTAERLDLYFTSYCAVSLTRDKFKFRKFLKRNGIPSVCFMEILSQEDLEDVINAIGFPCILKPTFGSGSNHVYAASNQEELRKFYFQIKDKIGTKEFGKLLVEEYLQGPLCSIETITKNGSTKILGITGRGLGEAPYFQEISASFPTKIGDDQFKEIKNQVTLILNKLNYRVGFAHTEFVITKNGPVLIELNPRIGGSALGEAMGKVYGTDFYKMHLSLFDSNCPLSFNGIHPIENKFSSFNLLYPKKCGTIIGFKGKELAERFPFIEEIHIRASIGDNVPYDVSKRKHSAHILAVASTPELAIFSSQSASNQIQIDIQKEGA